VTRQQSFFGRIVAATDLAVLFSSFLAAYWVRVKLWRMGYPLLPIYSVRASAWIITVMFPAWLIALRYFNLYSPVIYRSISTVIAASFKAQVLASVLMLNTVFVLRGFNGVSRPLLALIIMFSLVGLMTEKAVILFLMRYRWRLQRRSAVWRVLLVGNDGDTENYLELIREHPEWNLEIVDVISANSGGKAVTR
jgi:FlaA1/EpsC-like NDP-sugar epimerase